MLLVYHAQVHEIQQKIQGTRVCLTVWLYGWMVKLYIETPPCVYQAARDTCSLLTHARTYHAYTYLLLTPPLERQIKTNETLLTHKNTSVPIYALSYNCYLLFYPGI